MPPLSKQMTETPLRYWPKSWLLYRVIQHIGPEFLIADNEERFKHGWPRTRSGDLQHFLLGRDDKPEAGW